MERRLPGEFGAQLPRNTPEQLRGYAGQVARGTLPLVTPGTHLAGLESAGEVTALIHDPIISAQIVRTP